MIKSLSRESTSSTHAHVGTMTAIAKSLLYSFVFVAILTLLLYMGLSLGWVQINALDPIYMYGNYFAVMMGAAIAGLSIHGRGWLIGLVFACIYFIVAAIIAPVWGLPSITGLVFVTRLGITMAIGTMGGMIGVNL